MPEISGGPVSPVRQLPALPAGKHSAVAEAADAAAAASDRGRVSFFVDCSFEWRQEAAPLKLKLQHY